MPNKRIYKDAENILDEVLKSEPKYSLPDNFAEELAIKVSRTFAWEGYLKEFLIYLAVIVGILIVSAVIAFIWFAADIEVWKDFLMSNIPWVAGINILVLFVLFTDRVLLRYMFYKVSLKSS